MKHGPKHESFKFWKRVQKTKSCWLWKGYLLRGYGNFWVKRNGIWKNMKPHRWIYETVIGPIKKPLVIDHLCRVRNCVNPKHLRIVTNKENVLSGVGVTAVHAKKTHCKSGHPFSGKNLTIINNIRRCKACDKIRSFYKRRAREALRACENLGGEGKFR